MWTTNVLTFEVIDWAGVLQKLNIEFYRKVQHVKKIRWSLCCIIYLFSIQEEMRVGEVKERSKIYFIVS